MNTITSHLVLTQANPCKNCNKMKNEDQIRTYVRQMTDDMLSAYKLNARQ